MSTQTSAAPVAGTSNDTTATLKNAKEKKVKVGLTAEQRHLLKQQEIIIQRGEEAFLATARAIKKIDLEMLWKEHRSLNEYLRTRWDFSATEASRYKVAGEVLHNLQLEKFEKLPSNESQCRELGYLDPGDQIKVWKEVVKSGTITAALIKNTAIGMGLLIVVEQRPDTALKQLKMVAEILHKIKIKASQGDSVRRELETIEAAIAEIKSKLN